METNIIWQRDRENPENPEHLAVISQWWATLNGKEIAFAQRLIPESGNLNDINWETQRFDEKFAIEQPEIRGITLYWHKDGEEEERSITVRKLDFQPTRQCLDIYPQSQPQIVIRAIKLEIPYQTIELSDPLIVGTTKEDRCILLLRDIKQQLQVKLTLSPHSLQQLRENLPQEQEEED